MHTLGRIDVHGIAQLHAALVGPFVGRGVHEKAQVQVFSQKRRQRKPPLLAGDAGVHEHLAVVEVGAFQAVLRREQAGPRHGDREALGSHVQQPVAALPGPLCKRGHVRVVLAGHHVHAPGIEQREERLVAVGVHDGIGNIAGAFQKPSVQRSVEPQQARRPIGLQARAAGSHPLIEGRDRRLRAQQKPLPRRREPQHAAALGQLEAQLVLQRRDMLAQYGLGDMQLLGRMAEVEVLAERDVLPQNIELHENPLFSRSFPLVANDNATRARTLLGDPRRFAHLGICLCQIDIVP